MNNFESRLRQLISKGIEERLFPACVVGTVAGGQKTIVHAGTMTYENSQPVQADSIFDVASITKSIPMACLALKLIEGGKLGLHDDIGLYIPEYRQPKGDKVTVWNLLTHTVFYEFGFRLSSLKDQPPKAILQAIFDAPAKTSKTKVTYTNSSSILLGLVVEAVYGQDLPATAQEVFFGPLGMKRSGFEPLKLAGKNEIVPTETDDDGELIHGLVHDESTRALLPLAVGTAGLFSTVPDLLIFLEMLLGAGRHGGRRYFSPETIAVMAANQLKGGNFTGLGWELNQPRFMGGFAENTFGKTGFTGCLFLCNLKLHSGFVVLSNHIHPKRPDDYEPINRFRRDVADLVFGSV